MNEPVRVVVIDDGRGIGRRLASKIRMEGIEIVSESEYRAMIDAPTTKDEEPITDKDIGRIKAAEAKRKIRIERNQQRSRK